MNEEPKVIEDLKENAEHLETPERWVLWVLVVLRARWVPKANAVLPDPVVLKELVVPPALKVLVVLPVPLAPLVLPESLFEESVVCAVPSARLVLPVRLVLREIRLISMS